MLRRSKATSQTKASAKPQWVWDSHGARRQAVCVLKHMNGAPDRNFTAQEGFEGLGLEKIYVMGPRATLIAFRCLRRQLQSAPGSGKQFPPSPSPSSAASLAGSSSCSTSSFDAQGLVNGGQKEIELGSGVNSLALSFDLAHKVPVKDPVTELWLNAATSQTNAQDEWSTNAFSSNATRGVQHWTVDRCTEGESKETGSLRGLGFFSRYLQWRSYERLVQSPESQNQQQVAVTAMTVVKMDENSLPSRQLFRSCRPPVLQTSSLTDLYEEPSLIIPLEADSVKRKRKKKMNKHKQRKLRRRDRHRK
jgi:hypothetical protein